MLYPGVLITGERGAAPAIARSWDSPPDEPYPASLRELILKAAATDESGALAADALVCPRLRKRIYDVSSRLKNPRCGILNPFCEHVRVTELSHYLASTACRASTTERSGSDTNLCQEVFLGHAHRATALRLFLRLARRYGGCLQIRLENSAVGLYVDAQCPTE